MGFIRHDIVIAMGKADAIEKTLQTARDFTAARVFNEDREGFFDRFLLGPAQLPGGIAVAAMAADGSKEGWRDSDYCDSIRHALKKALGETEVEWLHLAFPGADYESEGLSIVVSSGALTFSAAIAVETQRDESLSEAHFSAHEKMAETAAGRVVLGPVVGVNGFRTVIAAERSSSDAGGIFASLKARHPPGSVYGPIHPVALINGKIPKLTPVLYP